MVVRKKSTAGPLLTFAQVGSPLGRKMQVPPLRREDAAPVGMTRVWFVSWSVAAWWCGKKQVPFDFAQGRLSTTPRGSDCGRDDESLVRFVVSRSVVVREIRQVTHICQRRADMGHREFSGLISG